MDSGQQRAALFIVEQSLEAELGALLFLFRVSGIETVCSWSVAHTEKVGRFGKHSPRFWGCLDGLTVGTDSTKIMAAELPLQGQTCFPCAVT